MNHCRVKILIWQIYIASRTRGCACACIKLILSAQGGIGLDAVLRAQLVRNCRIYLERTRALAQQVLQHRKETCVNLM